MCDGIRTVDDIAHQFSLQKTDVNGVPAKKAAVFLLVKLFEQGIIAVSAQPQIEEKKLQISQPEGEMEPSVNASL